MMVEFIGILMSRPTGPLRSLAFRYAECNFAGAEASWRRGVSWPALMSKGIVRASCIAQGLILALCTQVAHPQNARDLAAGCSACHGTNGVSLGGPRSLAGTPKDEIARTLRAFKSGERSGTLMPELAKGYSDSEIDELASWFSMQKPAP
jgi:cytochrome c553